MSADTADDYEYMEGLLTTYRARVADISDAWNDIGIGRWSGRPGRVESAISMAFHLLDDYCRPTCGHREAREDPESDSDCLDDTCACLCHQGEEWDETLVRWWPVDAG